MEDILIDKILKFLYSKKSKFLKRTFSTLNLISCRIFFSFLFILTTAQIRTQFSFLIRDISIKQKSLLKWKEEI